MSHPNLMLTLAVGQRSLPRGWRRGPLLKSLDKLEEWDPRFRDQQDLVGIDEPRPFPDLEGVAAEMRRSYS